VHDGRSRKVTASGATLNAAETALKVELAGRMRIGNVADSLNAGSPFSALADAWLEDLRLDVDRADGTKDDYARELRGLVLPFIEHNPVRELTVGRIELFLKVQRAQAYARAKHSRTILSLVLGFAVRRGIIPRNPVKDTSPMKKPQHVLCSGRVKGLARGVSVQTEFVAFDVLHHDARLVLVVGRQEPDANRPECYQP
jgi:hypothetical protein